MSELADASAPTATADAPAPEVSGVDDNAPPPQESGSFDALDFDKIFGLPPGNGQPEAPDDVTEVSDPPVPRQDAEVAIEPERTAEAKLPAEAPTEKTQSEAALKLNDKLNWDSTPERFREEYKALKKEYLALAESSLEAQFLSQPDEFAKRLQETSPTSYREIGTLLATESAEANPRAWIDYFVQSNPDTVAQAITGRADITAERLKAELSVLLDEDDEDVQRRLEMQKAAAATGDRPEADAAPGPNDTPEQKRIRAILEREEQQELQQVKNAVFQPIEQAVNDIVSTAGLEIKESDLAGKPFSELDDETKFKVAVNRILPAWIDIQVQSDPKLLNMQSRLEQFIAQKDTKSAMAMVHPARIAITNHVNELIEALTGMKAKARQSETASPANSAPPPQVRSAGTTPAGTPLPATGKPTAADWNVTEADLFGRG